jgi:hypothetical protein
MALHKFNEWQIDLKFYKSAKTSAAHRHIAPLLFERIRLVNHFEDARRRVEPKLSLLFGPRVSPPLGRVRPPQLVLISGLI